MICCGIWKNRLGKQKRSNKKKPPRLPLTCNVNISSSNIDTLTEFKLCRMLNYMHSTMHVLYGMLWQINIYEIVCYGFGLHFHGMILKFGICCKGYAYDWINCSYVFWYFRFNMCSNSTDIQIFQRTQSIFHRTQSDCRRNKYFKRKCQKQCFPIWKYNSCHQVMIIIHGWLDDYTKNTPLRLPVLKLINEN